MNVRVASIASDKCVDTVFKAAINDETSTKADAMNSPSGPQNRSSCGTAMRSLQKHTSAHNESSSSSLSSTENLEPTRNKSIAMTTLFSNENT